MFSLLYGCAATRRVIGSLGIRKPGWLKSQSSGCAQLGLLDSFAIYMYKRNVELCSYDLSYRPALGGTQVPPSQSSIGTTRASSGTSGFSIFRISIFTDSVPIFSITLLTV